MVSHRLLFSQPGTGTISDLSKLALGSGHGYSYRNFADWDLEKEDSFLDFLTDGSLDEQLRRSPAILMVFDGWEHFGSADLQKLISQVNAWTQHSPDLPVTVYWTVFEREAWRARELAEEILPLIAV